MLFHSKWEIKNIFFYLEQPEIVRQENEWAIVLSGDCVWDGWHMQLLLETV